MTSITSQHNPRIKELRKLHRRRERERSGLFLAEGEDLIAAAIAAGRPALQGYRTTGTAIGGAGFDDVDPSVLSSVSMLGSGTRAIGVYEQLFGEPSGPLCVYLHGVTDPGNVGAVLRSALAFGASSVAFGPGCADPHSPKAVRASMGAIFEVALARVSDVSELPGERCALVAGRGEPVWQLKTSIAAAKKGVADVDDGIAHAEKGHADDDDEGNTGAEKRIADDTAHAHAHAHAHARGQAVGKQQYAHAPAPAHAPAHAQGQAVNKQPPALTLLVGAERDGLPEQLVAACERIVHIPIASESLNAAMAATVALYEMTRPSTRVRTS